MQDGIPGPVPQYPIESVDRTLRLLTHLSERTELKLSEVRTYLEIGQSTAHRLMAMLVYRGFAVQDPESRMYRAGPALVEISRTAGTFDMGRTTLPILEWLADQSGETAHFGVLSGTEVRYINVVESTSVLRVTGRVGRLNPAHATSLGKAMLSTFDDTQIRELYAERDITAPTERSIADVDQLVTELAATRARGWARNRAEMQLGVCSVGVAVVHPARGLLGGFSIATPQARSTRALEKIHAELLRSAAMRLLDALT